jgi:cell division protein FtsB
MSARATATSPATAQGKRNAAANRAADSKSAKSGGVRLTPRASILGFIIVVAAIFAVAPARAFLGQRAERQQLSEQVAELQHRNAALAQQLEALHDPAELTRLARECLGLVNPGEIAFVPIPKGHAPTPPNCD